MMKRLVQMLCLLLCAVLLPWNVHTAFAEEASPEVRVLSVHTAATEEPAPSVRVLLRRLAITDRADLILDGVYTAKVGGKVIMSFPRKAEVTVAIRSGELYLFYEGDFENWSTLYSDFINPFTAAICLDGTYYQGAGG